ncbi:MAG: hypothetical protein JWM47_3896, partial [Acidimicrobiales bacterium]|nr:hypothetical protein [Acidimicrobiales bacterium]
GLAPTPLVAALVVALGAGALVGERPLVVRVALTASVCALVATAVASPSGPLWLLVVLLGALLLTVVSDPPPPTTVCPWLVSGFAALGIWAGAPDTEVALVAGALLAGSILTADPPWASARRAPGLNPWPAVCVLLTWGAAWGYRARPGGSGGAVIALVAVFAWLAVERRGGPARPRAGVAGALVATAAIIALGARTVGLDRSLGTRPALTVALAAAVAVAAMLTGASRRPPLSGPATGGTPPT